MSSSIKELLTRGVEEVIVKKDLEKRLKSGKKLRVKFGIDPTSPYIHLGHTVPLRKLKQFQDLGHKIVLIVGDFTATIGDPSGQTEGRKPLSRAQVKKNMTNYQKQIGKILDLNKTEIHYNSEWYDKLGTMFLYELTSKITVARAIERDDFKKRLKQDQDISILEVIYPLLQGYDSVAIKADVEIGGTDQKFNLLMGRKVQKRYGQNSQDIMTLRLLEGTDGVRKMSKSYDNYIGITEKPSQIFGKIMSIPDSLIVKYLRVLTDISQREIEKIKKDLKQPSLSRINPKDVKAKLAREIVSLYYNEKKAKEAQKEFDKVFAKKEKPSKIPEMKISQKCDKLIDLLVICKLASSKSEARRLIEQGGVKVDNATLYDFKAKICLHEGMILQVGKRKFVKIKLSNKK
jgi:tyrosyl-tRNA synthetase